MFKFLNPNEVDPPHKVSHEDKLIELANEFDKNGWAKDHPVLIGYPIGGRIQLLSGTHRRYAACMADIQIPVLIKSYEEVWKAWGTANWQDLMSAPLLKDYV